MVGFGNNYSYRCLARFAYYGKGSVKIVNHASFGVKNNVAHHPSFVNHSGYVHLFLLNDSFSRIDIYVITNGVTIFIYSGNLDSCKSASFHFYKSVLTNATYRSIRRIPLDIVIAYRIEGVDINVKSFATTKLTEFAHLLTISIVYGHTFDTIGGNVESYFPIYVDVSLCTNFQLGYAYLFRNYRVAIGSAYLLKLDFALPRFFHSFILYRLILRYIRQNVDNYELVVVPRVDFNYSIPVDFNVITILNNHFGRIYRRRKANNSTRRGKCDDYNYRYYENYAYQKLFHLLFSHFFDFLPDETPFAGILNIIFRVYYFAILS